MALAIITFELTIFGTFLTRSGFVQSVHAFAKSTIGWYFLAFMALVAVVAVVLIAWRWRLLRVAGRLESVLSRELMFLFNNWVLLAAALLVIILTIFPTLTQALLGAKINISAPAFNSWMIPVGIALLVLIGVGPMMGWRRSTGAGLLRRLLGPLIVGLVVVALLFVLGARGVLPLATFGLCAFVATTVVQDLVRGVMIRRRSTGSDPLTALVTLIGRNHRRYGGYIVHVGVVLMYLGFAGEAYKEEAELELRRGAQARVGRYTLRFDGLRRHGDAQKEMFTATLSVTGATGERLGQVQPARWIYTKHQNQPTSEVGIRRSAREDLFVALGGFSNDLRRATFKVIVNPLVSWIWIGFVLMALGAGITLVPARARTRRDGHAAVAVATVVLLILSGGGDLPRALADPGPQQAVQADPAPQQAVQAHREPRKVD
jgi:cytochrome c-type biogenesis protein CcmF